MKIGVENKIKICYIVPSLCKEGPINVLYNTIKYLDFEVFEVSLITIKPEKGNSRFMDFQALPVEIYQLAPDRAINLFRIYLSFKKIVKNINPNIIHAHTTIPLCLMLCCNSNIRKVYTIHNTPGKVNITISGPIIGRLISLIDTTLVKFCDAPICCSESVARTYYVKYGVHYKAIANGADLPRWNYDEKEKKEIRKTLNLQENISP